MFIVKMTFRHRRMIISMTALVSSFQTANHIARGDAHVDSMKALINLLDLNGNATYTVDNATNDVPCGIAVWPD